MIRKDIIAILAFALLGLFMISCSSSETGEKPKKDAGAMATSQSGGLDVLFAAADLDGNMRSADEFEGKALIINVWGTWCPPCKMEMPYMQKIYDEYKDKGLEIVGLAYERNPNPTEAVKSFVDQNGYNWVMLIANKESLKSLGVGSGVPYTVFVDRDGNIVNKHTGMMSYNDFKSNVEKII